MSEAEEDDTQILLGNSVNNETSTLNYWHHFTPQPDVSIQNQDNKSKSSIIIAASITAALGGVMFGYDVGIISGALLQLTPEFELTTEQKEMVVTTVLVGALVASLFSGWLGNT